MGSGAHISYCLALLDNFNFWFLVLCPSFLSRAYLAPARFIYPFRICFLSGYCLWGLGLFVLLCFCFCFGFVLVFFFFRLQHPACASEVLPGFWVSELPPPRFGPFLLLRISYNMWQHHAICHSMYSVVGATSVRSLPTPVSLQCTLGCTMSCCSFCGPVGIHSVVCIVRLSSTGYVQY